MQTPSALNSRFFKPYFQPIKTTSPGLRQSDKDVCLGVKPPRTSKRCG